MAEKLLDGAQIGAPFQKVCGEAVSQRVRARPAEERHLPDPGGKDLPDTAICQSTPTSVDEQSIGPRVGTRARRQIGQERVPCPTAEGDHAFLPPLPEDANHSDIHVHLGHIESHELRATHPGGIEQLQERPSPKVRVRCSGDLQKDLDFSLLEVGGDAPLDTRGGEGPRGVPVQDAFAAEVPEEGPEAGELPGRRGLLEPALMESGQEGADQEVVHIPGAGLAPELVSEVSRELLEVLTVGLDGVGRGVALAVEVPEEGGDGLFQGP